MADKSITVVEQSGNDHGRALDQVADAIGGELRATSIQDMVDKVLGQLRDGDCIKQLDLVGHGYPGNISVGDGTSTEANKHIDGNEGEWTRPLNQLKPRFCKGGKLRLLGCNTGVCDDGALKLQKLADFLGVEVCGTKRALSAADFGAGGFTADDALVCVKPGDNVKRCLTNNPTSGLMRDEVPAPRIAPDDYLAFGVQNVRNQGLASGDDALVHPFRDPAILDALLGLFDLTKPFIGAGLLADIDVAISLVRKAFSLENWRIVLDYNALVVPRRNRQLLFVAPDAGAAREFTGYLLEAQSGHDKVVGRSLDLPTPRPNLRGTPKVTVAERVRDQLQPDFRDLPATELLRAPVNAVAEVSPEMLDTLRTVGVITVGDLLKPRVDARLTRLARDIALLAALERDRC